MLSKSLVISNYNNDLKWLYPILKNHEYLNLYLYDKSEFINSVYYDKFKVKKIPNFGYNILSYCTHIIENYDCLDDIVIFIKGNLIEREHTNFEIFDSFKKQYFILNREIS